MLRLDLLRCNRWLDLTRTSQPQLVLCFHRALFALVCAETVPRPNGPECACHN